MNRKEIQSRQWGPVVADCSTIPIDPVFLTELLNYVMWLETSIQKLDPSFDFDAPYNLDTTTLTINLKTETLMTAEGEQVPLTYPEWIVLKILASGAGEYIATTTMIDKLMNNKDKIVSDETAASLKGALYNEVLRGKYSNAIETLSDKMAIVGVYDTILSSTSRFKYGYALNPKIIISEDT